MIAPEPPKPPYTLWKFGEAINGISPVRFSVTLTEDWLLQTTKMLDGEFAKIVACHKARGYAGY